MEAFCKAGDSSIAFCQVGDVIKAENAVRRALRDEIKRIWEVGDAEKALEQNRTEVGNGEEALKQSRTELGNGEEASKQSRTEVGDAEGYGKEQFCAGIVAEEKPPCESTRMYAVYEGFPDVNDVETDDWVSPRISFSRDFVMADTCSISPNTSRRVFTERKIGEQDNYSAEFTFLKEGPVEDAPDRAKGFMLSADELFFDGKLLPLPFPSIWAASDDLSLSASHNEDRQELVQNLHNRPMSRHLSFEIPKPASSSFAVAIQSTCPSNISTPCKSSHVGTSLDFSTTHTQFSLSLPSSLPKSSSLAVSSALPTPPSSSSSSTSLPPISPVPLLSLPSSVVPTTSMASLPSSSSSVTKCSTKLKDLFKPKRFSKDLSSPSQPIKDSGITSTSCKIPLSSRSFWPFSRSNSAGVSKSMTPPSLPCRSNSAGESHSKCDVPMSKQLDPISVARLSDFPSVGCSKEQGPILTKHAESVPTLECTVPPLEVATNEEENASFCSNPSTPGADPCVEYAVESRTMSEYAKKSLNAKSSGKKAIGSPGKRKGMSGNPGGKANGGKLVLRNLERCSAEKKMGKEEWRGLHRRGSFPVGARVSPVLNVAVYRGPSTPKIGGLFRFNSLLLSTKREKLAAAPEAAINWRNGA